MIQRPNRTHFVVDKRFTAGDGTGDVGTVAVPGTAHRIPEGVFLECGGVHRGYEISYDRNLWYPVYMGERIGTPPDGFIMIRNGGNARGSLRLLGSEWEMYLIRSMNQRPTEDYDYFNCIRTAAGAGGAAARTASLTANCARATVLADPDNTGPIYIAESIAEAEDAGGTSTRFKLVPGASRTMYSDFYWTGDATSYLYIFEDLREI